MTDILLEADFEVDVTSGSAPLTVRFTDTSLGSPTFWEWDFNNDGTINANQQSPTFTYDTAGTYIVKLRVSRDGLSDELIRNDPLIVEPAADFQIDVISGNAPLAVSFTDTSLGSPTSWEWDFNNDGKIDSNQQSPMFTYATAGTYVVKLRVSRDGLSDELTIKDPLIVEPVADFQVDVTLGNAPLTVSFTDTSLGSPTFWEWDFDNDGTTDSNQQSPTFTYDTAGTYVVKLRVSRDGLSDELIRIDPLIVEPVADFQVDVTLGNAPLTVSFTDTSLGSPTFWEWDFNNDGTIDSNQQSPMFTYDTAGTYIVTLRVIRDGLSDELIRIDPLIVEPVADFQVDITLGNAPLTVSFTDTSLGSPTFWEWDFNNDGTIDSNQQSPMFTYDTAGTYIVKLRVSRDGLSDELIIDSLIMVEEPPDPLGTFVLEWGSQGMDNGQFQSPTGLAVDSDGNVFVSDFGNYRIQKFDSSGNFLTSWGSRGSGDGQFELPRGLALDAFGNVYVADMGNHRIQKFDSTGGFLTKWGTLIPS